MSDIRHPVSATDMATLKCNSCGGNIASNARRVQCPHCGELFPFACVQCGRKLRPPFSVFDDERYLTHDTPPLTLCDEHYLRQCPDCENWFGAAENPGYFRCVTCDKTHREKQAQQPPEIFTPQPVPLPGETNPSGGVAAKSRGNSNAAVIAFAVCAFVALVGWMILAR